MSQVYIAKCPDYGTETVEAALHQSLQVLQPSTPLFQPGQRVVLKPNLLQAQPPEKAVTTHPTLVAAVARWVRQAGAMPIIADSPVGLFSAQRLRRLYEVTGMTDAAKEGGAELNYDTSSVQISCPEGRAAKALDAARVMVEADAIISLPKLKTHDLMQFTGAIKNLFGTVPGVIKATYHARYPAVERFSAMLIDIVSVYRPALTIMDAVVGMEGDGPSAGDPRCIGLLLASTDTIAVDVIATHLIGIKPSSVPSIAAAMRRGLTTAQIQDIEVSGNDLAEVQVTGFKLPRTGGPHVLMIPDRVPGWITKQLLAWPQAGSDCTACGTCVDSCPVEAITIVDGQARMDLEPCIRCYCCHEVCPEDAVELHQPLLGRLLHR